MRPRRELSPSPVGTLCACAESSLTQHGSLALITADTLIATFEVSLLCTSLIMGFEPFAPEHIQPARMG